MDIALKFGKLSDRLMDTRWKAASAGRFTWAIAFRAIAAGVFAISLRGISQDIVPKPTMSDAPLTSEQIAVYRTVLGVYLKGSSPVLNLADVTKPLVEAGTACVSGLHRGRTKGSASLVHRLPPSFVAGTKFVLVDPNRHQAAITQHDPENLIRSGVDDHQKITDEQLEASVKSAFDNGLFTLSEITFDKEHHRAAVSYSFVCGNLCGNGNTLVLERIGRRWKVLKRCGGWIS